MAEESPEGRSRAATGSSAHTDETLPDVEISVTANLLINRLDAWRHAVEKLEHYAEAVEKIYSAHAKEHKKAVKALESPLKEGDNWSQSGEGSIAAFFEVLRRDADAMVRANDEAARAVDRQVARELHALRKELRREAKQLRHSVEKSEKGMGKSVASTQEAVEELGRQTAAFSAAGGHLRFAAREDPYVVRRGVEHHLRRRTELENENNLSLVRAEEHMQRLEAEAVRRMRGAMEVLRDLVVKQLEAAAAAQDSSLHAMQSVKPEFEWNAFVDRFKDRLVDPLAPPLVAEDRDFPNMKHKATRALLEGSLERKSRNKLSWGWQTAYYAVTPAGYLHEFATDRDTGRVALDGDKYHEPRLSIYLPEALASEAQGYEFTVKGKDASGKLGGRMAGSSELTFKAHSTADAKEWVAALREVAGQREAQPAVPRTLSKRATVPTSTSAAEKPPARSATAPKPIGIDAKEYIAAAKATDTKAGLPGAGGTGAVMQSPTAKTPSPPAPTAPTAPPAPAAPAAPPAPAAPGAPSTQGATNWDPVPPK